MATKAASKGKSSKTIGRPSGYSVDVAAKFCSRIADGKSMVRVCQADDMPSRMTVFRWLENEEFRDMYARACVERREVRKEQLHDIPLDPDIDPQRARLLSDNIKWVLAKEEPRKYGDKLHTELTGADGGAVQFTNLTAETLDARIAELSAKLGNP